MNFAAQNTHTSYELVRYGGHGVMISTSNSFFYFKKVRLAFILLDSSSCAVVIFRCAVAIEQTSIHSYKNVICIVSDRSQCKLMLYSRILIECDACASCLVPVNVVDLLLMPFHSFRLFILYLVDEYFQYYDYYCHYNTNHVVLLYTTAKNENNDFVYFSILLLFRLLYTIRILLYVESEYRRIVFHFSLCFFRLKPNRDEWLNVLISSCRHSLVRSLLWFHIAVQSTILFCVLNAIIALSLSLLLSMPFGWYLFSIRSSSSSPFLSALLRSAAFFSPFLSVSFKILSSEIDAQKTEYQTLK